MRLWHTDILPYLPRTQLLAQWRELNSIFKKQDKHILINYIYSHDKGYLYDYSIMVIEQLKKRGYIIKSIRNFFHYFENYTNNISFQYFNDFGKTFPEHDKEYMTICYWNLREKYLRGQKDFTKEIWDALEQFYQNYMKEGK